jgi:uncharacterized protein YndB with AHSA1/START domain
MEADRNQVRRDTLLDAPASEIWEALTDERLLSEWLADEVELEPVPGGAARFRYADGEERRGTVLEVEQGRSLSFSWGRSGQPPSVVEFSLEPGVGGTRLVVVERGPAVATAPMRSEWTARLEAFAAAISLVAA